MGSCPGCVHATTAAVSNGDRLCDHNISYEMFPSWFFREKIHQPCCGEQTGTGFSESQRRPGRLALYRPFQRRVWSVCLENSSSPPLTLLWPFWMPGVQQGPPFLQTPAKESLPHQGFLSTTSNHTALYLPYSANTLGTALHSLLIYPVSCRHPQA